MSALEWITVVALVLAVIPAAMYTLNAFILSPPRIPAPDVRLPPVSVLIPARDEERGIRASVESVLASRGVDLELIVLDDHSRDRTRAILEEIAARDSRLRVETAPDLPAGWCGKQHACRELARRATGEHLVFLDADVRLEPTGLVRALAFLERGGLDLVSGVPLQECETWLEKLLIPQIHFLLMGFLPIFRMRQTKSPAYAAGCGQFFVTHRAAYERSGGHDAIRSTLHDGLELPASYRRAGLKTDLFDATPLARCRMYRGAAEVWAGLSKNATEGIGHPARIGPFTILLAGGQVAPFVLLPFAFLATPPGVAGIASLGAVLAVLIPRLHAALRFRQSLVGALLQPVGISILLALQWSALLKKWRGTPSSWKGRSYREESPGPERVGTPESRGA